MAFQIHKRFGCLFSLGLISIGLGTAGTVETFDSRTFEGTVSFSEEGLLIVETREGPQRVPFDQVRVARISDARVIESTLPKGWRAEAIGRVVGSSMAKDDSFSLSVSGGSVKDAKQQMAYFAHRPVRSDAEIAARIESVSLPGNALAGVMLRESMEPIGGLAFLAVAADRHLRFESREAGWGSLKLSDLGAVRLPIWLKLARQAKENTVTAYRSTDGVNWQKLTQAKLNCQTEPFPSSSDHWKPKFFAGAAVSGTSNETPAIARFDRLSLSVRGLLGEYFEDEEFRRLSFARAESRMDFSWGLGSPLPEIDKDHFSIRWTGRIDPKFSESYRFHVEADDSAKLWIDEEEVAKSSWRSKEKSKDAPGSVIPLKSGQGCAIRLEYKEGDGSASVLLGWSSKSQPLEVISSSALSYTYTAASPDEEGDGSTTNALPTRGILLRSGSFLAGEVQSADDTVTTFASGGRRVFSILNTKIARVVFRPSRRAPAFEQSGSRAGLFMKNGDFLEGDFQSVTGRTLMVSSVLLGKRKFNLETAEVVALVLNNTPSPPSSFEVQLLDGSLFHATRLRFTRDAAIVTESALGDVTIAQQDIAGFHRHLSPPVVPR